jgi:hypothetical protein
MPQVAVVDIECEPNCVVTRYTRPEQAEWFLGYLSEHGGSVLRAKVERGGYSIDVPEEMQS